jgi:DNA-binding GntR family transcriptional regulator
MNAQSPNTTTLSNTPELIARHLRQAILRGELKSRQPLRQDKLAAELGVSKIPVREALAQLKAEGLITYKSNRGAFVTALAPAEAKEIYLMRAALETIALEQAHPKLGPRDFLLAQSALLTLDAEPDPARWAELNWDFHAALYRPAAMPHLLATLQMLHVNVGRYLVLYLDRMAYQAQSQAEHVALLAACQAGDLTQAKAILIAHLQAAADSLITYLQTTEDTDHDPI